MEEKNILCLAEDWGDIQFGDRIVVFGVGRIGRRVLPTLLREFNIPFLIDNSNNKEDVLGLKVYTLQESITMIRKENLKIIVTTVQHFYGLIAEELRGYGLEENKDFCLFERFATEWNLRWNNKCVISKIDTVITSRCSLRCKNCNMFIGHAKCQEDLDVERLKKNFDIFFESVDYVYEYTLLGGEPFLHKELTEIIQYLEGKYGSRIGLVNLISNGTVAPKDDVLELLKKYGITVHISDYTSTLSYGTKLEFVKERFDEFGITYYVIPNNVWKDVVYPSEEYTADNPKEHMRLCGHGTHSVDDGRLYWCDPAFAAEYFTGYKTEKDDYLDLKSNKANNSKYEASVNVIKYLLGDINGKGYMSFCRKCAGVGSDNEREVKAGIQM